MEEEITYNEQKVLNTFKGDIKNADVNKNTWDDKINTWVKEYNGEPYGNEDPKKKKSTIVSRDIKRTADWQLATIIDPFLSNDNIVRAIPQTHSDTKTAFQSELLLNYQFCRDFDRYNFITNSFRVLQREGTVFAKVSWKYREEIVEVEKPITKMMPVQTREQAYLLAQQGLPPFKEEIVGYEVVEEVEIIENKPFVELVRNSMLWVDPTAEGSLKDAKFVAYKYKSSLSQLREDGRYKNLDKIKIDGRVIFDEDSPYERDETFVYEDEPRREIEVTEYWGNYDLNGDGIAEPIVCVWVGDTVIRLEENPYPDGSLPFVSCAYDPEPYSIYGNAIADVISADQKVKTGIKRAILDTLDASKNGQKGVKKGTLDVVNKNKFIKGENFEFLGSPQDFWEGNFDPIPADVLNFYQLVDSEIQTLTGVRPFGNGNGSAKLDSLVGQQSGAMDAVARREIDISRNFKENFLVPILRKWHEMNVQWLDDEQIIRIVDDQFVAIRREDLEGKIDISLDISTAEVNMEKSNNLSFMLQTMAQTLPFDLTKMLLAEQARLKNMPELAKRIEEYQPQPDPIEQEKAQLENEKIKAEIAYEYSRAQENGVDGMLKTAKAQAEQAKARKTMSDADMTDLDFLRKQQGIEFDEKIAENQAKTRAEMEKDRMKFGYDYLKGAGLERAKSIYNPQPKNQQQKQRPDTL